MTVQMYPSIPVLIAPPEVVDEQMTTEGTRIQAILDTGSTFTALPESLVDAVFKDKAPTYLSPVEILSFPGQITECKTVLLKIAIATKTGEVLTSISRCLVSRDLKEPFLGKLTFDELGVRVTLDYRKQEVIIESINWANFEDEVARCYRALGAAVKQNVNLAGFQIDVYVEEVTPSKQRVRQAVECKFYKSAVGNRQVNEFSSVVQTLKGRGLVDKGVMVSASGFTQDAHLVAGISGVELLAYEDLLQAVQQSQAVLTAAGISTKEPAIEQPPETVKEDRIASIFVVMPFTSELTDVYHFGIREVVSRFNMACERADEIEYAGGVLDKIFDSIRRAKLIIAEVTAPNPNVYYEVGYAHAMGIPVILLTKHIEGTPFDLRGFNHIVYQSIVDLREKLERRLRSLLNLGSE